MQAPEFVDRVALKKGVVSSPRGFMKKSTTSDISVTPEGVGKWFRGETARPSLN